MAKAKLPKPEEGMMAHIQYLRKRDYSWEQISRMWNKSIQQLKFLEK